MSIGNHVLCRNDSLETYFKNMEDMKTLVPVSNYSSLSEQEIFARLHYNQIYVGKSVVDKITNMVLYKHQVLASRYLFSSDSLLVIHEPGTGKTKTNLNAMMKLLTAKVIVKISIINRSSSGNNAAIGALEELYYEIYRPFYGLSFSKFKRKYIALHTLKHFHTENYPENSGIIIDEAHNIMSDTDGKEPKKAAELQEFVRKISTLKGIKLILASATPIFGKKDNLDKLRKILFREIDSAYSDKIPQFNVSYTKINYDHLIALQILNENYTTVNRYGEKENPGIRDFEMDNEKVFKFNLYVEKPAHMQIADFFELRNSGKRDTFQSTICPIIIQSDTEKRQGKSQSTILSEVIKHINRSTDGTIIIYSKLKDKGVFAIAKVLDEFGFENYIKGQTSSSSVSSMPSATSIAINRMKLEIVRNNDDVKIFQKKDSGTSPEHYRELTLQLSSIVEDKQVFERYVNDYKARLEEDLLLREKILGRQQRIEKLKKEIALLIETKNKESTEKPKMKYLIYTSGMSAEAKKAFAIFNSEENWNGSKIKVIIGSQVMRDGVNIFHAVQTHILISEWRMAGNIQAQFRGFRSNGHDALIHNRACIKSKNEGISYNEAKRLIREEKIKVEIYNHVLDFNLIDVEDVEESRQYMPETELSSEEILQELQSPENRFNGGMVLYNRAIEIHKVVGAELMKLQSSSIDYMLNVREDDRIKDAINEEELEKQKIDRRNLLGVKDTELFFMEDYLENMILEITNILIEKNWVNTDELVEKLINRNPYLSVEMISTAIMELVTKRKFIYNQKTWIDMQVKLSETEEESILYLCTGNHDPKIHPYNAHVHKIGYSLNNVFLDFKTAVDESDLEFPKNEKTFYKLKDAIELLMKKGALDNITYRFLEQMSNYWAFDWKELANLDKDPYSCKVYVFKSHIDSPGSNVFAENLSIHEYNPNSSKWTVTNTSRLKKVVFTRYITLFKRYLNYDFRKVREFSSLYTSSEVNVNNGYALVKSVFDPIDGELDFVDKITISRNVLSNDVMKNVVTRAMNTYKSVGSKGNQLGFQKLGSNMGKDDKEKAVNYLKEESENSLYFIFFLYNRSEIVMDGGESIFDIKRHEIEVMERAIEGLPTLRFQINFIEKNIKDLSRKKEIYQDIYGAI